MGYVLAGAIGVITTALVIFLWLAHRYHDAFWMK